MSNTLWKWMLPLFVIGMTIGCSGGTAEDTEKTNMQDAAETANEELKSGAMAEMVDTENKNVGTVTFTEHDNHMMIEAKMKGLEPGYHGFHIHEKGVCEPDAEGGPFTTAKGHYNPGKSSHSEHAGDMPSLFVNEDGKAEFSAAFDRVTMEQLLEQEKAIIVHADPDNAANIPDRYQSEGKAGPDEETMKTGDAGDRQACGVIKSEEES
ncbi:superoxide dismutase family protein [Metabacillus idriensis]|uniref:superoxide dismutase family protein n=1 Tax=Metabacillus idriensis TaxID=324768 RepID=UPI003D2B343D